MVTWEFQTSYIRYSFTTLINKHRPWKNVGQKIIYVVVSNICYFHPYLGKWSDLTNIFQTGWNHQLVIFPLVDPRNCSGFCSLSNFTTGIFRQKKGESNSKNVLLYLKIPIDMLIWQTSHYALKFLHVSIAWPGLDFLLPSTGKTVYKFIIVYHFFSNQKIHVECVPYAMWASCHLRGVGFAWRCAAFGCLGHTVVNSPRRQGDFGQSLGCWF